MRVYNATAIFPRLRFLDLCFLPYIFARTATPRRDRIKKNAAFTALFLSHILCVLNIFNYFPYENQIYAPYSC